ncbi:MAG: cytoplasmic protein [Spirochaetes bacterium GWF1_51_8]|nr:MAG: cytoplasmic protein [Spirochaetes bacterium GWF1_51_8]
MSLYIAFLRGINVGGRNMIKMADLRKLFDELGFSGVETYIQSGNILFYSDSTESVIREKAELEIRRVFGFPVPVVLRTLDELTAVIRNCPFSGEAIAEAESVNDSESMYIVLLSQIPSGDQLARLNAYLSGGEEFHLVGRDGYLLIRHSIRVSKLAGHFQILDKSATVRNWKTINKLVELARVKGNDKV